MQSLESPKFPLGRLKKELKDHFFHTNTTWVARESLKRLKHTKSMINYVKEFSSLMLDIKNVSEGINSSI